MTLILVYFMINDGNQSKGNGKAFSVKRSHYYRVLQYKQTDKTMALKINNGI